MEDHKKLIKDTEQQINERKRAGDNGTELQRLYRDLDTYKKRCKDSEEDMKRLQVLTITRQMSAALMMRQFIL